MTLRGAPSVTLSLCSYEYAPLIDCMITAAVHVAGLDWPRQSIRLRRINLTLSPLLSRAYRLVHRAIGPIAGFRDFVSYLRYRTKIEFSLLYFPIRTARRLYGHPTAIRQ